MKRYIRSLLVSAMTTAILSIGGCKHEPNPPTEQDAIAVWKSTHESTKTTIPIDLISLKKTNGQIQEINGQKVYTLYYEAVQKNLIRLGDHPPGGFRPTRVITLSNGRRRAGRDRTAKSIRSTSLDPFDRKNIWHYALPT